MSKRRAPAGLIPAAAQQRDVQLTLSDDEQALSNDAIATFEAVLGGRDALAEALAVAESAPEVDKVSALLLDARYDTYSLRRICAMAGLTIADLFAAYKKATLIRAHLQLAPIIASRLVGIVQDLFTRAQPHYLPCGTCRGAKSITPDPTPKNPTPAPEPCAACQATGQILHLPELDRQKLALEIAEVIKPKGGFTFNQANILQPGASGGGSITAPGALEQMQQAVSSVLYADRAHPAAIVEGEATPVEEGPA
jgi:hypothetical protein